MKYKKTTLKNGLRIITIPMKGTETVTVTVMVGVGSRYESEKEAGISHFIEHMFFKGTQRRPTTLDISAELDSIGGEFNAFTAKDKTMYYAKVDAKHLDRALDTVADMYLHSKLEEKEIGKERGTILQELNMYEDTPTRSIGDAFENLLYKDNPLGRDIIGNKKTLKAMKRKDFIDFMDRFYKANDTVVSIAGKFDEKKVIAKVKSYFEKMGYGEKPKTVKVDDKQNSPGVKLKYKKTDQAHLILGVRAYHHDHKDRFALALLSIILGGNMSSRLFIEVREKRGLAYYVRSMVEAYKDCGYLAVQAGVEHDNLELAISTIIGEFKKISREKVSAEELKRAKDFVKGKSVMGMEASDAVAMFFLEQEVMKGKIMTMEEIFARVEKVAVSDILRVAKEVFRKNNLNLAIIGPHKDSKKFEKLLKI